MRPTSAMPLRSGSATRRGPGLAWWLAMALVLWLGLASPATAHRDAGPATAASTRLKLWFSHLHLNPDPTDCRPVFMVERQVPATLAVATASLQALFAGPTPEEAALGYRSPFSAASAGLLKSLRIHRGTAYVDLHDLRAQLSGVSASCGAAEFRSQLTHTLLQFPSIQRLRLAIEGEPRVLHGWLNEPCGPANDHCDARPFRRSR